MKRDEALKAYSIPIPKDYEKYDKEEYREFDNMFLESFYSTFYNPDNKKTELNKENKELVAIVLGGQAGAGKSSLVADAKIKFKDTGRRIIVIDDDEYRKYHPYAQEIIKNCPELYTEITAMATNIITPKILKFAAENRYNFLFDGTMKNTRIINTMKEWKNYNIFVHVMATCGERSLISTAIRNGELRETKNEGRVVDQNSHWEMYNGLPKTLDYIETHEPNLVKEIKIYTRSNNPLFPKEEYSSLEEKSISSSQKLEELRNKDRQIFFNNSIEDDIQCLKGLIVNLSEAEKAEAQSIIDYIKKSKNLNDLKKSDNNEQALR